MRTKALLCAAALAAGIVTSMAQSNVYSLNVVGYYNVTVAANSMQVIANQFNTADTKISTLLPNMPEGTTFYKYVTGTCWTPYNVQMDDFGVLGWFPDGNATLNPGEAGLFKNVTGSAMTLTFVGEVPQGSLTNALPGALAIRSSIVPQAGKLSTDLAYPGTAEGDTVYKYVPGTGWSPYNIQMDDFGVLGWFPSEPEVAVGEGFFSKKVAAGEWTRTFNVQ